MNDTHFFFVRVWQHQHQFRAAVQSDNDGEPRLFTAPEQVGEFLRRVHVAGGGAAPQDPADNTLPIAGEPASRKGPDGNGPSPTPRV